MNERIKELAEQAAEYCKTQPREIAGTMWEEKFAELIVRECINTIKETNLIDDDPVANIKKRFGVEE
jgi:hypothetical protein